MILASLSPRRQQLLEQIGLKPLVKPANIVEIEQATDNDFGRLVQENGRLKVQAIAADYINQPILIMGADTIVVWQDQIFGKPNGKEQAAQMLKNLSGSSHFVYTGLVIFDCLSGQMLSDFAQAKVSFAKITEQEIAAYLATAKFSDKAGGYGIQDKAALFIEQICGDYTTVVGLPLSLLRTMIKQLNL